MEKRFVDHLFSKIVEGRFEKALSAAAARAKLSQLEDVSNKIRTLNSDEAVQNVLGYREVKRSLEQCLDFIENSNSLVEDSDFSIYLEYAENRLKEAEVIIDSEQGELGL
jgi:hypothetical protein